MFVNNKIGASNAIWVVVVLVIALFVGYMIISVSSTGIRDAADEIDSLLYTFAVNCDADNDGSPTSEDLCPCNHDDLFESRIYYIVGTYCEIKARCAFDPKVERISLCYSEDREEVAPEKYRWNYSIDINSNDCEDAHKTYFKNEDTLKPKCKGKEPDGDGIVVFNIDCATEIFAMHTKLERPTFSCNTPTRECKKTLKKKCS